MTAYDNTDALVNQTTDLIMHDPNHAPEYILRLISELWLMGMINQLRLEFQYQFHQCQAQVSGFEKAFNGSENSVSNKQSDNPMLAPQRSAKAEKPLGLSGGVSYRLPVIPNPRPSYKTAFRKSIR